MPKAPFFNLSIDCRNKIKLYASFSEVLMEAASRHWRLCTVSISQRLLRLLQSVAAVHKQMVLSREALNCDQALT